jgi:acetyl esterase/lipase
VSALNADYWRGGWRTPLGDEPHIYEFVIRGTRVTGVYCRNCSDATTIGFIDGTWDEKAGVTFTVTFANPAGRVLSADDQHAMLVDGRLIVSGVASIKGGKALTLVKDPRGADPGGAPAYHLPPGTPPALPVARAGGGGGGGGGRGAGAAPYWQAGPFKTLRPSDLVGTWIASFGLGMNRQLFTFLLVGDRLRGVVCGRCDNPYTIGAIENVVIAGDRIYFDIVHQDWGEIDPPTFDRSIVAQLVQNEMIAAILGNGVVVDPAKPPTRPAGRGFTLVGPIAPESTRGNSSEGIDVWGTGTGSGTQPPAGRTPIAPAKTFAVRVVRNVPYLQGASYPDDKDKLDLYLPEGRSNAPVIVSYYGNQLMGGDKEEDAFIGRRFATAGFVSVVVNYRLTPDVSHPAHAQDAAASFAWVKRHIAEYGGNPDRVFVIGYSAGGYLAALLSTDPRYLAAHNLSPRDIRGTVPVSAFYWVERRGVAPDRDTRVWGTDPKVWVDASPAHHLQRNAPPMLILYADRDEDWRRQQNVEVAAAMKAAGLPSVDISMIGDRTHASIWTRVGDEGDPTAELIIRFASR